MCNLKHIHTSIPAPFVALPPATPVMWHAETETQTVVVVLCRSPSPSQRAVEMLSLLRCVSAWQNKTHLLGPRTYYYCHASAGCLSDVLTKPHSQESEPLLAGDIQHIDQADGEAKRRDNSRSVEGLSVLGGGGGVCPEICLVNMHIRLDVLRYSMGR